MTTFNYESDIGAVGDGHAASVHMTINIGTNARKITTAESVFGGGATTVGMGVSYLDLHTGQGMVVKTITAVNSATEIIVNTDLPASITAEAHILLWGTDNGPVMDAFQLAHGTGTHSIQLTPGHKYFHGGQNPLFGGTAYTQISVLGDAANKPTMMIGIGHYGTDIQYQDLVHSARTNSVSIGQNYVVLKDPTQTSLFIVGRHALMTGFALQLGGFPTNHAFFQFNVITAVDSTIGSPTYGRVTFADPFEDVYLDSWPYYSGSTVDDGGPATLYAMPQSWQAKVVYSDMILAMDIQHSCSAETVEFNNIDFLCISLANSGIYPTFVKNFTATGGDWGNPTVEIDKYVWNATYNGVANARLFIQSMSNRYVTVSGCTGFNVFGTPRSFTLEGGSVVDQLILGPSGPYGFTEEVTLSDSTVTTFLTNIDSGRWLGGYLSSSLGINNIPGMSLSAGVIRIPKTEREINWAIPGYICFFEEETTRLCQPGFRVVSCTEDGTDTIITIDPPLNDWLPRPSNTGSPLVGDGIIGILKHPAARFTSRNMSGDKTFEGLNEATARAPYGSYHKATYISGTALGADQRLALFFGNIIEANYTVNHAYAGGGALGFYAVGAVPILDSANGSNAAFNYQAYVDMKVAGPRTITVTPLGVTGSGGSDSGLALPDAVQSWAPSGSSGAPRFSANVSGTDALVSITVEVITDQYFVFEDAVNPPAQAFLLGGTLGLRLRNP